MERDAAYVPRGGGRCSGYGHALSHVFGRRRRGCDQHATFRIQRGRSNSIGPEHNVGKVSLRRREVLKVGRCCSPSEHLRVFAQPLGDLLFGGRVWREVVPAVVVWLRLPCSRPSYSESLQLLSRRRPPIASDLGPT